MDVAAREHLRIDASNGLKYNTCIVLMAPDSEGVLECLRCEAPTSDCRRKFPARASPGLGVIAALVSWMMQMRCPLGVTPLKR